MRTPLASSPVSGSTASTRTIWLASSRASRRIWRAERRTSSASTGFDMHRGRFGGCSRVGWQCETRTARPPGSPARRRTSPISRPSTRSPASRTTCSSTTGWSKRSGTVSRRTRNSAPSCPSRSTISRSSTTASGIRRGTRSFKPSRVDSSRRCARPMRLSVPPATQPPPRHRQTTHWRGSAATTSSSCCLACQASSRRAASPTGSTR